MEQINMKIAPDKKIYFTLLLSVLFLPSSLYASIVYIDSSRSEFFVGDTVLFNVRVDSEKKSINALEGSVMLEYLPNMVSLIGINTSGSPFSLWPSRPLPSENNTSISFAGGSPGGLTSQDAVVFNIAVKLQKEGRLLLAPSAIGVYLNDGKGTKDQVRVKSLVIDILPPKSNSQPTDDWSSLTSNDTTPPEPFEIYAGQEGSVFDGRKFLSFSTTDGQSGVAYYEVLEGNLPPVRANDTYILQEQNKSVKVTVTAYDSSGNARKSIYNSTPYSASNLMILLIVVVLVTLVFAMCKKGSTFLKKYF